jgi:hypothetical protein
MTYLPQLVYLCVPLDPVTLLHLRFHILALVCVCALACMRACVCHFSVVLMPSLLHIKNVDVHLHYRVSQSTHSLPKGMLFT